VILEERSQRTDSDPGALFGEQMRAAQYLNHPYGIPIIGWRHEMEGLTARMRWILPRLYAPNNAILIVAGDVTPDEVRALAETITARSPPRPTCRRASAPAEPPQLAERRLTMADPRVAQPYVAAPIWPPNATPARRKGRRADLSGRTAGRQRHHLGAGPRAAVRHAEGGLYLAFYDGHVAG
jgi:zinc protease